MSSVDLLSREDEMAIAKRIEAGREAMIAGLCESPLTFQAIIIWRDDSTKARSSFATSSTSTQLTLTLTPRPCRRRRSAPTGTRTSASPDVTTREIAVLRREIEQLKRTLSCLSR